MRVVWGCQSCQSNLLTLSYHFLQKMTGLSFILDSLVIFTNFHTHSYHTLKKKTFDYVWYYCICKYPIRKFCTPIHYIICNIYLWGFFSVDWMAPHSLEMRKSFLMKCSSGTFQTLSYFELKIQLFFHFVFQNDCKFWRFLLEHFIKHHLLFSEECAPYGLLAQDIR